MPADAASAPAAPEGRFDGREPFRQVVRDALAAAAQEGWREIILSDPSFEDWPLGERQVVESLQAWAKTGRRLTLLARTYDNVLRGQPRFVTWRTTWAHLLDCRRCAPVDALAVPSAIWSPDWSMQRLDVDHERGVCGGDVRTRLLLRETIEEVLRRSTPGFPTRPLGL